MCQSKAHNEKYNCNDQNFTITYWRTKSVWSIDQPWINWSLRHRGRQVCVCLNNECIYWIVILPMFRPEPSSKTLFCIGQVEYVFDAPRFCHSSMSFLLVHSTHWLYSKRCLKMGNMVFASAAIDFFRMIFSAEQRLPDGLVHRHIRLVISQIFERLKLFSVWYTTTKVYWVLHKAKVWTILQE